MLGRFTTPLAYLGAIALIAAGFYILVNRGASAPQAQLPPADNIEQVAAADLSFQAPPPPVDATTTAPVASPKKAQATTTVQAVAEAPPAEKPIVQQQAGNEVFRTKDPYPFPPASFEGIDSSARAALVNILCSPRAGSTLSPISGSGVLIDPRGVILTNAHVAQYVLLSQSPQINLTCTIRSGAPAAARWKAEMLYIPSVWVEAHAHEVADARPVGTGEHDYALLRITHSLDGVPLGTLPFLPIDTREGIGFKGDKVLALSYPAEFLGAAAQFNLYPAASVTTVGQLMTFFERSIDMLSLGGIVEAQSGSSGGAVINAWGRLIALISTTSEGETTAARDLRAVTLSYISRDLAAQTLFDLPMILGGDVQAQALDFNTYVSPRLIERYLKEIR